MKIYTILILSLILFGCSSTYTIKDFSSKNEFYNDFNNFSKNKSLNITLTNDSTFSIDKPIQIYNDSLYEYNPFIVNKNFSIPIKLIKKINYSSFNYKSADISLIDGREIKAENIIIQKDSLFYSIPNTSTIKEAFLPINKIKTISYKDHWTGVTIGIITGYLGGFAIGWIDAEIIGNKHLTGEAAFYYWLIPSSVGTILGGVLGWLCGYNYIYTFN